MKGRDLTLGRRIAGVIGLITLFVQAHAAALPAADSLHALQDLRMRLDKLYTSPPYRTSAVSAKVISLRTGEVLYERNADKPLTPASTTKLFSTATLYAMRGGGADLITDVRTEGTVDASGILDGDLFLVGCGDALLTITDIDRLAEQLERLGIKKITGGVYGDGYVFDSDVHRSSYSGDNEDVEPLPPITALSLQRGTIAITASASRSGQVILNMQPASDGIELVNAVQVSAGKSRSRIATPARQVPSRSKPRKKVGRRVRRTRGRAEVLAPDYERMAQQVGDAPRLRRGRSSRRVIRSIARLSASSSVLANGIQRIVVAGRISPGTSTTVYASSSKPALIAAGALRQRLRGRGIVVLGPLGERAHTSKSASIASVRRPLVELASIVNKKSDNYLAEHVFKMCGAAAGARPSNARSSTQCVVGVLDSLRVPRLGCVLNDGSGLSRRNQTSASTQVALLQRIASQPWADEYKATLAVAGADGTIRKRLIGTFAANNVNAKTGTLRNVSALSGYVTTRDGEPLAFALISNGNSVSSYKYTEDMAALVLASFSRTGVSAATSAGQIKLK